MDLLQGIMQIIGILFAIAVVFFLAWFVTRAVAMNGSFNGKARYFTILERFPINKDSYIMLVKSFDKLLLVGVTAGGMTVLREFENDEIDLEDFVPEKQTFSSILNTTIESSLPEGRVRDAYEKFIKKKNGGGGDE